MKFDAFIIAFVRQENEIVNSLWGLISKELDDHRAFICLHMSLVFLLRINLHFRGGIPLLCHVLSFFDMRNELFRFLFTFFLLFRSRKGIMD